MGTPSVLHRLAAGIGVLSLATGALLAGCSHSSDNTKQIPKDIEAIFGKPIYAKGTWGLRVVDLDSGDVLYDVKPERQFLIGSVRKVFSVGALLNQVGPGRTFATPVHRQGAVAGGVLDGDLVLVASGDLTMGGRTKLDGTLAIAEPDHSEANSLGNAALTEPDPLAGYAALARQVAASGIVRVRGEVVIDDRLFVPFNFRDEFKVSPIFVNDDAIDVMMRPTAPGLAAAVEWRPKSAAFEVASSLVTAGAGTEDRVVLEPELPTCIGTPGCKGTVSGELPVDFVPPFTNAFPLVRAFRIVEPANYARTVFIEALRKAGVTVDANSVTANPRARLPARNSYTPDTRVAQLVSLPYADYARWILKVSYNIGADTSLVLFGVGRGVDTMADALAVERQVLASDFGIAAADYSFIDGGGGGTTAAKLEVVTTFLRGMRQATSFPEFRNGLPILGVDGSLGSVHAYERDPSLAGARGQVLAKTGTFIAGTQAGISLRAKALAGYITTKSGRRLVFALSVNDLEPVTSVEQVFATLAETSEDEGTIAAILWREQ